MGWASGSALADTLWTEVRKEVSGAARQRLAREFVVAFSDSDCDTLDECPQLIKDAGKKWVAKTLSWDPVE